MGGRRVLTALLLTGAAAGALPVHAGDGEVRWRGRDHDVAELPAELSEEAREAVATWAPWAASLDLHMYLSEGAQVLFLGDRPTSRTERQLELVERTVALFEECLPRPERAPEGDASALDAPPAKPEKKQDPGDDPIPEDPEDGPAPWELYGKPKRPAPAQEQSQAGPYVWGSGRAPHDTETVVFLVMEDEATFHAVLDLLAEHFPYLATWAREDARRFLGFSLQSPLVGGYVASASGQEEWNPDNELVNRLAQLLLARRFGTLPNWFVQGWAWTCETRLLKGIWCYPYRDEFVFTVEHTSWGLDLRRMMKDRRGKPIASDELTGWRRGVWDGEAARIAWGLVDHLLREHPAEVPRFLEELRLWREEHDRIENGDGTWRRDPAFVIPAEVQREALERAFGDDLLEKVSRAFAKR